MRYKNIPGWMSDEEIETIRHLSSSYAPDIIVEIGSFLGKSASAWAEFNPNAEVWCVDCWLGKLDDFPAGGLDVLDPKPDKTDMDKQLYSLFLRNVAGLKNIRNIRCYSKELIDNWREGAADLVFIDGDHSEEGVINDLNIATFLTMGGGVITGHDYDHPYIPSVKKAVDEWALKNNYNLMTYENTMIYRLTPPVFVKNVGW